jgi:hypothetical protein
MIVSSSATARNIESVATKLSVPLPPAFLAAVEAARILPREAVLLGDVAELHAAALSAIRSGADPGLDKNVQRLTVHRVLAESGIRVAAESWAGDLITEAIAEHADTIVTGWATAIQSDADTLHAAADQLDQADLNAADPVMLKRSNLLGVWADCTSAAERCDAALGGMRALLTAMHVPHAAAVNALMLAPTADLDTVKAVAASVGRGPLTAWDIARSHAPLKLATIAEFRAGIARLAAEDQQRETDAAEAEEETQRRNRTRQGQPVAR